MSFINARIYLLGMAVYLKNILIIFAIISLIGCSSQDHEKNYKISMSCLVIVKKIIESNQVIEDNSSDWARKVSRLGSKIGKSESDMEEDYNMVWRLHSTIFKEKLFIRYTNFGCKG